MPSSTAFQLSAGRRQAEVVDRHVLARGEAVVGLDGVDLPDDVGDAGALPWALVIVERTCGSTYSAPGALGDLVHEA